MTQEQVLPPCSMCYQFTEGADGLLSPMEKRKLVAYFVSMYSCTSLYPVSLIQYDWKIIVTCPIWFESDWRQQWSRRLHVGWVELRSTQVMYLQVAVQRDSVLQASQSCYWTKWSSQGSPGHQRGTDGEGRRGGWAGGGTTLCKATLAQSNMCLEVPRSQCRMPNVSRLCQTHTHTNTHAGSIFASH